MTTLTFLGAASTVTGSKFLVDDQYSRFLVDCGLFQGDRDWRRRNWQALPIDPATIDAVLVTHAHLDHCGYLPVLVRNGFSGPVFATPNTTRLAAIVLRDAAHLQEEDAHYANQHGYSKHRPALPLFDSADADKAISLFRVLDHNEPGKLPGGADVRLRRAGHILGSAFVELEVMGLRLLVSGDLGRPVHPLLRPPERPHPVDFVVVESTYGDQRRQPPGDDRLAAVIRRTAHRGGVALLPAFAVDRTAMLLHTLARLETRGAVPEVPVYVDSPMALNALQVYDDAARSRSRELRPGAGVDGTLLRPRRLRLMPTRADSEQLNNPGHPCVLISASGMATGGRVLHHLRHQLPNPATA